MGRIRAGVIRFGGLFHRQRREREMAEELESHLQMHTEDNMRSGMTPQEARRQALIKLGGLDQTKETCRDGWGVRAINEIVRDMRYGLRQLRRNSGFTTIAVLTLAVGIGANAAMFSVVNSVLLEPLGYPNPQELVAIHQEAPGAAGLANFSEGLPLSPSMYFTYAEHNRTFQSLGEWTTGTASVTGGEEPEQVKAVYVSDGVLETLEVPPAAGRWLSASDHQPHGPQTVMLSYGYWQRRFGGSRSVIGRNLDVDSRLREIVGVMPSGFRVVGANFDLLIPLAFDRGKLILAGFGYQGIARLKPSASIKQADSDIARMVPIWMRSWSNGPGTNPLVYKRWRITPDVRPLKRDVVGNVADDLWVVMATLGIVMLIACANVGNLLLVRIEARQQEIAIRAALGAPKTRIVRQLLLECVILGLLGGAAGLPLAEASVRLLLAIGPANLPRLSEISVGGRTIGFTLGLALFSALLFGLFAAVKQAQGGILAGLRSESRTTSLSGEQHRTRNTLVVIQVAMAFVLLVCAGLMIRTFQQLREVDPGFSEASRLELFRISIPPSLVPQAPAVVRMQNQIVDNLRAIPGVNSAAFASEAPMEGIEANWDQIMVEGKTYPGKTTPLLYLYEYVSPDFFETMGTRLVAGRELTWTDVYDLRPVGLVSENLARELWGSPPNAIGKQFREFPGEPWRQVIGVVQDVFEDGVTRKAPEIVYWPTLGKNLYGPKPMDGLLNAVRSVTFVVRSNRAGTESFLTEVRRAVRSANAMLPLASVRTMQDVYDKSLAQTSFALVMLAIAAAMALLLGIIGLYGVLSYIVGQRTHEFGIRMALGAQKSDVLRLVAGQGLKLILVGVAIGVAGSLALTRLLSSRLFGVKPNDPVTFITVSLILTAAALLASYIPARRAANVDPMMALRFE
jgi:putative ABC transport system permease protein